MLHDLNALAAPALMERLTLVINHVLASETIATDRLKPHAGRVIRLQLDSWPKLLPKLPSFAFLVTPAGMLEWCGVEPPAQADLQVHLDASNPAWLAARLAGGETPALEIQGDAGLATDVNWLIDHVRWDVAADLERFFGPTVGHQIGRLGSMLAGALRSALRGASELATRMRRAP